MHLKGGPLKIKYSKNLEHLKFLKSHCRKTSTFSQRYAEFPPMLVPFRYIVYLLEHLRI